MSTAAPSTTLEKQHVFISYSHKDRLFVDKLDARLKQEGLEVWLDRNEIRAGDSIQERVEAAIENACFVLVVLSKHSVNSAFVQDELRSAMAKQRKKRRRFVVPILRDRDCEIPIFLLDRLRVDFTVSNRFASAFDELVRSLELVQARLTREATAFPEKDFVAYAEQVAPKLVSRIKDATLTGYYLSAVRTSAAGHEFMTRLLVILSVLSNSEISGGVTNANFMSHMGFMRDLRESTWISSDLAECLRRIVIERSISYPYRRITFHAALELVLSGKLDPQHVLGSLFCEFGFDPLLDCLVEEEFSPKAMSTERRTLAQTWTVCNPRIRKRIIEYCVRTSRWRSQPRLAEYCHEGASFEPVIATLKPCWNGLLEDSTNTEEIDPGSFDAALADPSLGAGKAIELVERAFRTAQVGRDKKRDQGVKKVMKLSYPLYARELERVRGKHGTAARFKLLSGLIASPYVNAVASLYCLTEIRDDSELSILTNHSAFPQCLFLPKNAGVGNSWQISLIDSLTAAATHGMDNFPEYAQLSQLALSFHGKEFRVGLYGSLRRMGGLKIPELQTLRRYVEDEITGTQLAKDLNRRVARWLSQQGE